MYNNVAADMNGPKGISSFLLLILAINNTRENSTNYNEKKINKTPFTPK